MNTTTTIDPLAERRRSGLEHAGTIRAHFPWWDTQVRPGLVRAIEAVPAKDLDFKPRPELLAGIEGTRFVGLPAESFPGNAPDHIYLIDPFGNLMMRFPRDPDPSRMIKDLQRLLKYSGAR